jgi:hypothetical protein
VVQHFHLGHLGTPRAVSNATATKIGIHAYYPFGTELDLAPHEGSPEALKFTGPKIEALKKVYPERYRPEAVVLTTRR